MISNEEKSKLAAMSRDMLIARLRSTLDSMTRTSNLASLADLADYAGAIYTVLDWRGLTIDVKGN